MVKKSLEMKIINKRKIGFLVLTTLFVIICVLTIVNSDSKTSTTKTEIEPNEQTYNNNIDLRSSGYIEQIEVDCFKTESAYFLLLNNTEYKLYYANSDLRHFIYANFSYTLNGKTIEIYTLDFSYSLTPTFVSTSFLISKHVNSSLEFEIERTLTGKDVYDFYLSVNSLVIHLEVEPASAIPAPPFIPSASEPETEVKKVRVSWLQDLNDSFKQNPILAVMFGGLIFGGLFGFIAWASYYNYLFKNKPPLIVKSLKKETINLGRFLLEKDSEILPGFRTFWFKKDEEHAGLRKVHCRDSYAIVQDASKKRINLFQMINLDYHHLLFKLPESLQYYEHLPIENKKNKLLAFLIRNFPNARLATYLQKKITLSPEENLIVEVEILENRNAVNRVTPVIDATYIQKISDEKKGEIDKKIEWKTIPYYDVFRLKQDESVRHIRTKNPRMELLDIRNREFAEEYQDSIESVRATHYIEYILYKREHEKTVEQLTNLLATLNFNKLKSAKEQAQKIVDIQTKAIPNIEEIMEAYVGYLGLGYITDEAKQLAFNKTSNSRFLKEQERTITENPDARELIETKAKKDLLEQLLSDKLKNKDEDYLSKLLKGIEITEVGGGNNKKKDLQIRDDYES